MKKHVALFSSVLMMSTTLLGTGSAFASTTDVKPTNTQQTPVSSVFTLPDGGGTNPTPPGGGEDGNSGNNNNDNPTGAFAIAYHPKNMAFSGVLAEEGDQDFQVTNSDNKSFNIGVKDKTRNTTTWTLKARFSWNDSSKLVGSTIKTFNSEGTVKINKGEDAKDSTDNLETTTNVTGTKNAVIGSEESVIMSSNSGVVHNAVYDYELKNPTLNVPNIGSAVNGTYNGKITWNLSKTPQ
ncbi:WxL domain-containing protein [Enterococcus faecium]|nr:WxL domain-containing protein [Enterococcus faecium]